MENGTFMNSRRSHGASNDKAQTLEEIMRNCLMLNANPELKDSMRVNNDIADNVVIYNNASKVSRVLQHLLKSIFTFSRQNQIRISAKTYSDVVLIHLRDAAGLDEEMVRPVLLDMQPWVEELGGFLDITSHRTSETTIAFSFPNIRGFQGQLN